MTRTSLVTGKKLNDCMQAIIRMVVAWSEHRSDPGVIAFVESANDSAMHLARTLNAGPSGKDPMSSIGGVMSAALDFVRGTREINPPPAISAEVLAVRSSLSVIFGEVEAVSVVQLGPADDMSLN
jgi:hypothetical protein